MYIVAVCLIGGGKRSTGRKQQTCRKSLTNFIRWCFTEYTSSDWDSPSQCCAGRHVNPTTVRSRQRWSRRYYIVRIIMQYWALNKRTIAICHVFDRGDWGKGGEADNISFYFRTTRINPASCDNERSLACYIHVCQNIQLLRYTDLDQ